MPGSRADVAVVLAVRNEHGSILKVVRALGAQTTPPGLVVVVNDGSTDGTGDLLRQSAFNFPFELVVVDLPSHQGSYVGKPQLARVLNAGLSKVGARGPVPSFVMKLDGDHVLHASYLESILTRMTADGDLAVASGYIAGERFSEQSPRGSGMVARTDFWIRANGLRFPLEYGWESWLYLKAQSMGYRTRSFPDIVTQVARPTSMRKGALYGRGMYALGYFWLFVVGRCLAYARYSPTVSFQMLQGFLDHRGVKRLDVSGWVNQAQRRTILRRIGRVALRRGFGVPDD